LEPLHRIEIDTEKCTYPQCTACLMYCPAAGSIVEAETGRSLVPPPPEAWRT
jgi:Pyruvate/2-oxoacid:ferredoxin oxidoreductase delta subunit